MRNIFHRRLTIVLASVGAVGAIAAIATAASLALFYDPAAPSQVTFTSGNVTLTQDSVFKCSTTATTTPTKNHNAYQESVNDIYPGYSTTGYPDDVTNGAPLGDRSGTLCSESVKYTGSLAAFLGVDVTVATSPGTGKSETLACNGGDIATNESCEPLYNPSSASGKGLEVWVFGSPFHDTYSNPPQDLVQTFGIGNDQTVEASGSTDVSTTYGPPAASNAAPCQSVGGKYDNCPVTNGFVETLSVYVYWPLDSADDQNVYQNSSATVTLAVHAVQAADNPLYLCGGINDNTPTAPVNGYYYGANQPKNGWGAGLYAGVADAPGSCPTIDNNSAGWTGGPGGTPDTTLIPFFHPDTLPPTP
ncbi:MAG: hypothetical protein ACREOL_04445 [Candidatus Dormibacteria bacterium]